MEKPRLTRWLEKLLNPLLGKSIALYFVKPAQVKPAGEDEALTAVENNRREVAA
ncbi:hypothetical protein [Microbulbifer sp. ALW1]|uniref:hypothetical protein n=1 Tax=Microbulbifer sp. (strain ALW1) TaxID=1516059 RepID=UPI00351A080C